MVGASLLGGCKLGLLVRGVYYTMPACRMGVYVEHICRMGHYDRKAHAKLQPSSVIVS